MRIEDLKLDGLLEIDSDTGVLRFGGQRALLLDAEAMGVLREYLVANFGLSAARAVLTHVGFAHGYRLAEMLQSEFSWASDDEWRRAGIRMHALQGLFQVAPGDEDLLTNKHATILGSYEAEQHLVRLGRSESPVCWTICGLLSGYLSRSSSKEIYVVEDRCVAQGHAACRLLGRTREDWGVRGEEDLAYLFGPSSLVESLDVSLREVTTTLKAKERKLRKQRRMLKYAVPDVDEPLGIVAKSKKMQRVLDLARRVAQVDATVLITGESGVGKERIAHLIHDESTRADKPFVAINCGAITETLLESELFGHKRGAFTGAASDRPGLFEAANHGTLLLDEIGEMSLGMQVKLLRVLQEQEVRRVGENTNRSVDVRVLAATNRDLAQSVEAGEFREDLYYRVRVVELHIPPLRDRKEDILPLAQVLLADAAHRMGRDISGLTPGAANQLLHYGWAGNVRELENAMERAAALARGNRVEIDDLPEPIGLAPPKGIEFDSGAIASLGDVEKQYILAILEQNDGNRTRTAQQLQIGSATLYRKLKSYRPN